MGRIFGGLIALAALATPAAALALAPIPLSDGKAWEHKETFPLWAGTLTTAGGLLFIGHSESLQWVEHPFKVMGPTIYRKEK